MDIAHVETLAPDDFVPGADRAELRRLQAEVDDLKELVASTLPVARAPRTRHACETQVMAQTQLSAVRAHSAAVRARCLITRARLAAQRERCARQCARLATQYREAYARAGTRR
jgi:hypothetical protein